MLYKIGDIIIYENYLYTSSKEIECEIVALLEFTFGGVTTQANVMLSPISPIDKYTSCCNMSFAYLSDQDVDIIKKNWTYFIDDLDKKLILILGLDKNAIIKIDEFCMKLSDRNNKVIEDNEDRGGLKYL
jgi:hypothetical protein